MSDPQLNIYKDEDSIQIIRNPWLEQTIKKKNDVEKINHVGKALCKHVVILKCKHLNCYVAFVHRSSQHPWW